MSNRERKEAVKAAKKQAAMETKKSSMAVNEDEDPNPVGATAI
jgi:hypothetical protein